MITSAILQCKEKPKQTNQKKKKINKQKKTPEVFLHKTVSCVSFSIEKF
jgi:hypothetical protein